MKLVISAILWQAVVKQKRENPFIFSSNKSDYKNNAENKKKQDH